MSETAEAVTIDLQRILEMIPHRYPMLLIDRVEQVVKDVSATGIKAVTMNEEFFQGHFPGHPVMPGVLIVEAIAQAAGILGFVTQNKRPADNFMYLLCGIDNARFKRQVRPGDQLELTARFITTRRHILKFAGEAKVDDQLVASVDLLVAEHFTA